MQGSKASHANNAPSQQQLEQEKASGFSLFRLDTIQLWAWLEGHQPLDELSLKSLSEDISYRIREITDNAINYMHHCKRNELKSIDLDNAFHISNIDKTFGFSGKSPLKLNRIDADKLNDKVLSQLKTSLFELKDENVELSLEEVIDTSSSTNIILANNQEDAYNDLHGRWLIISGNKLKKEAVHKSSNLNFELDTNEFSNDIENELFLSQLAPDYKQYYDMITSIVLGEYEQTIEDDIFMTLLDDLKSNPKLQPMLPFLINFLSKTIQSLIVCISSEQNSVKKKIYFQYMERCIETLRHLILNSNIFLAPKGIYSKILSCLLFCILQNSFISHWDVFELKELSSSVLVTFLRVYKRFSVNSVKYITEKFFLPRLNANFNNEENFFTIYGIISCFTNFGGPITHQFYSKLKNLAMKLDKSRSEKLTEISTLLWKKLMACFVSYYVWFIREHESNSSKIYALYKQLVDLFGVSFVHLATSNITADNSEANLNLATYKYRSITRSKSNDPNNRLKLDETFDLESKPTAFRRSKQRIQINYGNNRDSTASLSSLSRVTLKAAPAAGKWADFEMTSKPSNELTIILGKKKTL